MGKLKKGHTVGYKYGHVPDNKQRKCVSLKTKDNKQTVYVRLTRQMTNLVTNVPFQEDKSAFTTNSQPAILLRPNCTDTKKDKKVKSIDEKQS